MKDHYVTTCPDTDQQCLVAYGEDGGAVLDESSIPKLLACHGLDLPADVSPGILAELVTAARAVDRADIYTHERPAALASLRAALAKLAPVSPPPAKPKGYAWKTDQGYLANQGREHWFESEPVGWALFCEPDHAATLARSLDIPGEAVPVHT